MNTVVHTAPTDGWAEIDNNLTNPDWYQSGAFRDAFRLLRDQEPLHRAHDERFGRDYWVVSRFDDVRAVVDDHVSFSNSVDSRIPRTSTRLSANQRREMMFDSNVALMDPPLHTLFRQPINKHFSVPAIGRMREEIATIIDGLLENLSPLGGCDIVDSLAAEIPMRVVFSLLGIPESDWPVLTKYAWQAFAPADPRGHIPGKSPAETSFAGIQSIAAYALAMARDRRETPREDFATIVAQMVVDGTPLDDHEISGWFVALIIGGLETSRNAISAGTWLFLTNPNQRDILMSDPGRHAPNATEEVLRWVTPARGRMRVARVPYELHGQTIEPGDWVFAYLSSANWDERHFEQPEVFDITRTPNDHLSLGVGIHLCLGRALARLELTTLWPRLFAALPDMKLVSAEPDWIADHQVAGLRHLPVTYSMGTGPFAGTTSTSSRDLP